MTMRKFDCLVVGDVMLDFYIGNRGKPIAFSQGGTSYCDFAKLEFGGAGNIASGLSLLGSNVCFIGKAGNDPWGRMYENDLNDNAVTTRMFFEQNTSTGLAFIGLGKDGERSFHVFRGANDKLSSEEMDRSVDLIKNSEYLYFSGYSLVADPQRDAIIHAIELAKRHNTQIVFDSGAHNLIRSSPKLFNDLLEICDVFCPNFEEAKAIVKTKDMQTTIRKLQNGNRFTALKCGENGCILIKQNEYVKVSAFKVDCIDTTGAGDAFVAAIIHGLVQNFPLKSIGQLANWFAAQKITGHGARSFPAREKIASFLKSLQDG